MKVKGEFCGGTGGEVQSYSLFGWRIENSCVDLFVTETGGQIAPVYFFNDTDKPEQPYYVSPWQKEQYEIDEPVLLSLRGDFFCMPFGANEEEYRSEKHCVHGETAGGTWNIVEAVSRQGRNTLILEMHTKDAVGKVTKQITLIEGQNVIYTKHILEGYNVKMPLGHHAILKVPEKNGDMLVSSSMFDFGMTNPFPASGERQLLVPGKEFTDLSQIPSKSIDNPLADFSTYPTPPGFDDIMCIVKKDHGVPAWTVAVYPKEKYLWFSLKDSSVLPQTVFWISNKGRDQEPWLGRNVCLGIEDICGFFAQGLKDSCKNNILNDRGYKTAVELSPKAATEINYIQGVARIPDNFRRVVEVLFETDQVVFVSGAGERVTVKVDYSSLTPEFD